MTQRIETEAVISDKHARGARADAARRLNMVQGVHQEIIAMLASKKRGFSVDDYYHLADAGILHEDDRVELINGILVEVVEGSVSYDRSDKLPRYAQAGVPEVWIANLPDDLVERYSNPVDGEYREVSQLRRGDRISPALLPDVEVRVDDVLP